MAKNLIYRHEDWQREALRGFLAPHWHKYQDGPLPAFSEVANTIAAYVNHGRWIAECPNRCGNAIVVSQAEPHFICFGCGSPENDGKWYNVMLPSEWRAIEQELLKRPARVAFEASHRNWIPGETVADLRAENAEHGVG